MVKTNDDNEPEEIKASSNEILQLKLLHEQLIESTRVNKKRKTVKVNSVVSNDDDDDKPLALSIIEAVEKKRSNSEAFQEKSIVRSKQKRAKLP